MQDVSLSTSDSDTSSMKSRKVKEADSKRRKRTFANGSKSETAAAHALLDHWKKAYADLLQRHEAVLKRLETLEKTNAEKNTPTDGSLDIEIPMETAEIKVTNIGNTSGNPSTSQNHSNNISRNERYEGLVKPKHVPQNVQPITTTKKTTEKKPAPIFIRLKSSKKLVDHIIKIIGKNTFFTEMKKKGTVEETKLQVQNESQFRAITKALEELKIDFYTFQLKSEKGITVVLKGLEADLPCEEIRAALQDEGYKVKSVINMINRFKVPQPLFKIELDINENDPKKGATHPVYNLRYLLHRRVTVEEPHRRTGPVQCHNCQEFGHTKKYCHLPSVCVICGDKHTTSNCNSNKNDKAAKKCCNCGDNHTANYRGCPVYTIIKNKSNNKKINTNSATSFVEPGISYAKVAKEASTAQQNETIQQNQTQKSSNDLLIQTMTKFMNSMQQMLQETANMQMNLVQILTSKQ